MQQFQNLADAKTLALAVVDAIADPFVVLDDTIRLVAASRSFYETFQIEPEQAHGRRLYELCDGEWDIPELRQLLETVIPEQTQVDGFELHHHFAALGDRTMLLNARLVASGESGRPTILVGIKDITARRLIELEKQNLLDETAELLRQQRILFKEMQHRVANSLQIIASILMLKARGVASQETRDHLNDAHQRVMSVAEVQAHLNSVDGIDQIDGQAYLIKLCQGLASSMTGPSNPVAIEVVASEGTMGSAKAVSLGLIVTELVINAIKYAFPEVTAGARILVTYAAGENDWQLAVADNGVGRGQSEVSAGGGLGTAIIDALAKQLRAPITATSDSGGLKVVIGPAPLDGQPRLAA